jgi:hypothetical protein
MESGQWAFCCKPDHATRREYLSRMSARQQLIEELNRQPEQVAGELLTYLHSLPGYTPRPEKEQEKVDYWETHWSKFYGICEGEEWEEPPEQPYELREEW